MRKSKLNLLKTKKRKRFFLCGDLKHANPNINYKISKISQRKRFRRHKISEYNLFCKFLSKFFFLFENFY